MSNTDPDWCMENPITAAALIDHLNATVEEFDGKKDTVKNFRVDYQTYRNDSFGDTVFCSTLEEAIALKDQLNSLPHITRTEISKLDDVSESKDEVNRWILAYNELSKELMDAQKRIKELEKVIEFIDK